MNMNTPSRIIPIRERRKQKEKEMETISIKDDNGKVYEFEKPSFTLRDIDKFFIAKWSASPMIFGYVISNTMGQVPIMWNAENGTVFDSGRLKLEVAQNLYNLTPIKSKWYKDESNFPAWIISSNGDLQKAYSAYGADYWNEDNTESYHAGYYKLATKEEVLSLYYEGK